MLAVQEMTCLFLGMYINRDQRYAGYLKPTSISYRPTMINLYLNTPPELLEVHHNADYNN
jgi:hypothetical protein